MIYLVHILVSNVIPLCIMITLGIIMQRCFKLDNKTMSKLLFYLFSPVLVFVELYQAAISGAVLVKVLAFFILFFACLLLMVQIVIRWRGYRGGMKSAMRNSVIFYNSANYGIPLNHLVFSGNPFAVSIQIVMMMLQNLLPNTYGVYAVNAHKQNLRQIIRTILRLPSLYGIPLAFLLRGFHVPIPEPIWLPLHYIANGFLAFALTTLGVQLGHIRWQLRLSDVAMSNVLRLIISPIIGYLIVILLGLHGITAKALILSTAVPTSLSSMLLAVEFDNEPEFASRAVFSSTLFSIITVTIVISMLQYVH